MYNLRHIDPLCMSRGYVILIWNFSHRSTVYSGGYAIFWQHGSTVYDWWPWPMSTMSSVCDLSMGMSTSEFLYIWYSTDAWLFPGFRLSVLLVPNTHMQLTKSIGYHWFHPHTLGGILLPMILVIMMMYWWWCTPALHKNFLLRKNYFHLFQKTYFWRVFAGC